jgi:hypothetical protein
LNFFSLLKSAAASYTQNAHFLIQNKAHEPVNVIFVVVNAKAVFFAEHFEILVCAVNLQVRTRPPLYQGC